MELGETITQPVLSGDKLDAKCPFDHHPPKKDETKNELGGDGGTLGDNMAKGKPGVGVRSHNEGRKSADPWDEGRTSVTVKVAGEVVTLETSGGDERPLPYPLCCAAHHLIPAQESLKDHPVLAFMCRPDKDQDFKNGKEPAPAAVADALVWGNVGYNVNGCQNGVWLPGNYAVGGGKGAVEIWKTRVGDRRTKLSGKQAADQWVAAIDDAADGWDPDADEEENEGAALRAALVKAKYTDYALAGTNFAVKTTNPKWGYVKACMDAVHGQFHDRHKNYSKQVVKYLDKINDAYVKMYKRAKITGPKCEDCKKAQRPEGAPADAKLVGPPAGIVGRLVTCSEFFRRHLAKKRGKLTVNIYTSRWVYEWFRTKTPDLEEI